MGRILFRLSVVLVVAASVFSPQLPLAADERGDGLEAVYEGESQITLRVYDEFGNPISTIERGNIVRISASYPPLTVPLRSRAVIRLPTPSQYEEKLVFDRNYAPVGVSGTGYYFYIPDYIQYQGTARVEVIIGSLGFALATFEITAPVD